MKTSSATQAPITLQSEREKSASFSLPSLFGTTWEKLQASYYPVIAMTILIGSCISGAAAANLLRTDAPTWQLAVCASLGMFNNTTAIGSMPVKWVVWSFVIATIGNASLIVASLF